MALWIDFLFIQINGVEDKVKDLLQKIEAGEVPFILDNHFAILHFDLFPSSICFSSESSGYCFAYANYIF